MTNLNPTAAWDAVRQLETTDPVLGGPPNPDTGDGMDNIPHYQLARRDEYLRNLLNSAGLGANLNGAQVPVCTDLNALVGTRFFKFDGSATGAPANVSPPYDAVGWQIDSDVQRVQYATISTNLAVYTRIDEKDGAGWSAWRGLVVDTRSISVSGLATGGGDLTQNRSIDVPIASDAEAQAASSNAKAMTPLRTLALLTAKITEAATAVGIVFGTRKISVSGLATGGGDFSADRTIGVPAASQTDAEAGSDNTKAMTPLRVFQAIAKKLSDGSYPTGSRAINTSGLASGGGDLTADRTITVTEASDTETLTGTSGSRVLTPRRLKTMLANRGFWGDAPSVTDLNTARESGLYSFSSANTSNIPVSGGDVYDAGILQMDFVGQVNQLAFASAYRMFMRGDDGTGFGAWQEVWLGDRAIQSLSGSTGYQVLPSGLIIQWGKLTSASHGATVTFPIAFPTACNAITFGDISTANTADQAHIIGANSVGKTSFVANIITHAGNESSSNFYYTAMGY